MWRWAAAAAWSRRLLPGGDDGLARLVWVMVDCKAPGTSGTPADSSTVSGRSSGNSKSAWPRTTARSIAFSSSRTLPGHEVVEIALSLR